MKSPLAAAKNKIATATRVATRKLLATSAISLALSLVTAEGAETGLAAIKVPPGFSVELAAAPPLVKYPMLGGFDELGRLYVCESSGGNYDEAGLLKNLPNFVRRLEDKDGDGKFDAGTIFADKMTFPEGALWRDGALYVTSPPYLWRLEDTDGDGVADKREPIVGKFRSYGHAGDIHGPFLAPDGRLAFTDAPLGHEIRDKQGRLIQKGTAARVFLCDADGGNLETFCGGGTYNPIEVAFTPAGEMLGIMTWYNPDEARHDALVHFVLNGVYPRRVDAWINEFKRSGPLMPAITRYGVVAPSGILRYRSGSFGPGYADNYFVSYYNTHRVNRIQLKRDGATFRAEETPFLESTDPDFRACDVVEDADGSLLVIDTGGWFINGCPSAKFARPEKLGAIYRVRRKGAPRAADPRGLALDWKSPSVSDLALRLADPRPCVVDRAMEMLGRPTEEHRTLLATLLLGPVSEPVRLQAVWALARHRTAEARHTLRQALRDGSAEVRLAAARCAGMDRDAEAWRDLTGMLASESPAERREAASALSRLGRPETVPALLRELARASDRFLEHAIVDALTRIASSAATAPGLSDASPITRRGALIALDQMDGGALRQDQAAPLLQDPDPGVRRAAAAVCAKRPAWAQEAVGRIRAWLPARELPAGEKESLRGLLAAFWGQELVRSLARESLSRADLPTESRRMILEVWSESGPAEALADPGGPIADALASPDDGIARAGLALLRSSAMKDRNKKIAEIAEDGSRGVALRLAAAEALADEEQSLPGPAHEFALAQLRAEGQKDALFRLAAARILGRATGDADQMRARAAAGASAGPVELPALAKAFEKPMDEAVGLELVASLEKSAGLEALSEEQLEKITGHLPPKAKALAMPILAKMRDRAAAQTERLKALEPALLGGDAAEGRSVFFGSKTGCAVCHRVREFGGSLGPDLSSIGEVRSRKDLLEAVVFPSASFARGYEPTLVTLRNGETEAGLLLRESETGVELRRADQSAVKIPRAEIQSIGLGGVSLMPQGLEGVMTLGELRSLLAFLESLKAQPQ